MGIQISSLNGLKTASGYELFILTYGLENRSPEFRAVQENFSYFADILGAKGVVITGSYDRDLISDFSAFINEVEPKLYNANALAQKYSNTKVMPTPALVVLRKNSDTKIDVAYLSIRNFSEDRIVALFRKIIDFNSRNQIEQIPNNLLAPHSGLAQSFWNAIQIKPNIYGLGIDVKELLKRN